MMARTRLRTKLVLSLIFTTAVLSGASLLIVQNYLRKHAKEEIDQQIPNAFGAFEQYAMQLRSQRRQSARVAADLSYIRALMSTTNEITIQDVSEYFSPLTKSDLFLLADPDGKVKALHSSTGAFDRETARAALAETLSRQLLHDWWTDSDRLYEVFLEPVYRGLPEENEQVGVLVMGFAVDDRFVASVARITSSEVAFRYGKAVMASSLAASQQQWLSTLSEPGADSPLKTEETPINRELFVAGSKRLAGSQPISLTILKSYDAATRFLQNINHLLLSVGLVAVVAGSILMFLISHTLTRPLARLASGVVALEKGDFSYPLNLEGRDEVAELTKAFDTMRTSLKESQQHLLHAERLATIGRMASTISHDLRHPLTTVLAYAELLSEGNLNENQRAEMYRQIRSSVNNMAELIASLLEFSKAQEVLQLQYGDCVETLQDTIQSIKLRPEFSRIRLTLVHEGPTQGWFDFAKLHRVFNNLLRNACEAVEPDSGRIRIVARGRDNQVVISVSDNGSGIPEHIRDDVFQPFVTSGKADGTGLGLAVVQKIVGDHGGKVEVESTGTQGTTFKVTLPVASAA